MSKGENINNKVFVAGAGVISAIGNDLAANLHSLQNSEAGMGKMKYLDSAYKDEIPVAEVKLSNLELAAMAGVNKNWSRTALLSLIACNAAVIDAGINDLSSFRTGFISANTVGGMDKTENFYADFLSDHSRGRLRDVVNHECGAVTELVADKLGINSYVSTISTACSSSANAIFFGARMIKYGLLDVVIAGGCDAITRFTLNGFNTLMILDREFCRPFDENRMGLNLGEGAGYIVMVSEKIAQNFSNQFYCELTGYCNSNDAYHQTASSPDGRGSFAAMKGALEMSGIEPADISYINLHGTGTANNDMAEGTAVQRLFEPNYPKISSTKSFTGHTLGASGGIEAVYSALAVKKGLIYPNLRLQTPIKEFPFRAETNFLSDQQINHVLSNSFGFGGNCSSLIFSKIKR